ncbi:MAG: haloacid dehalogenase-like hydrolase [Deltaproteobacteria bacterium]|nr:haloacid dehalogenase-like hydrolase [Deltaproteobacteria bacterium]
MPLAQTALLPERLIAQVKEAGRALPGGTAAFDADGTLWRDDVGEAFLKQLVHVGLVKLPDGRDPYEAYEARVHQDRGAGFAYAAQLQAGVPESALVAEAKKLAPEFVPSRLIASTQALLALCTESGLRTFVVSASPIQIVRAAAPLAGVPVERLFGMTVRLDAQGRCTDELAGPSTYAEGKVQTLVLARLMPLALGCGDSIFGDLALLSAARVPVVVAPEGGNALAEEGARRGWARVSGD